MTLKLGLVLVNRAMGLRNTAWCMAVAPAMSMVRSYLTPSEWAQLRQQTRRSSRSPPRPPIMRGLTQTSMAFG